MSGGPRSAAEIISDPEYQRKRRKFEEAARPLREAIDREAQSLLDDLKKFGLHYGSIDQLVNEKKNTFVLAIPRLVEYLDIFQYAVNIDFLAMSLARPEAKGLASKALIRFYRTAESKKLHFFTENTLFQVSKAIHVTAEPDDAEDIVDLLFSQKTSGPQQAMFIKTLSRLKGRESVPYLLKCLTMDEAAVLEALKALKKFRSEKTDDAVRALLTHKSAKVRKQVTKLIGEEH